MRRLPLAAVLWAVASSCAPKVPAAAKFVGNDPCVGENPVNCDDGNVCTADACKPKEGCVHQHRDNEKCDDDNACTDNDRCSGVECAGVQKECNDANPCTESKSCDKATGCQITFKIGQSCDDGDACTVADDCGEKGACEPGNAAKCDDNNPCTDDGCDKKAGCNAANAKDGAACTAHPCAEIQVCQNGSCQKTKEKNCDDSNPCTSDSCSANGRIGSCEHTGQGGACSDGDPCTENDNCVNKVCTAGAAKQCDDNNACTDNACDLAGNCTATANAAACDDANACTKGDTCSGGVCKPGGQNPCDDGNTCTVDHCDGGNCNVKANPDMAAKTCAQGKFCLLSACTTPPDPAMVLVAAVNGFEMGCTNGDTACEATENPRHSVNLSAFWFDRHEVTTARFKACVDAGACTVPSVIGGDCSDTTRHTYGAAGKEQHPVNCVTWAQATAFCAWAVKGATLPTEAQFEYVLRNASTTYIFPWGNALPPPAQAGNFPDQSATSWAGTDVLANYTDGFSDTAPVGSFPANKYGVFDVHGNVWEWTRDWFGASYFGSSSGVTDPAGPTSGTTKVVKGGGFKWAQQGNALRNSFRLTVFGPEFANWDLGFRCAIKAK